MNYQSLGRTGLRVSEIGFGAWGIGGLTAGQTSYGATDDAVSRAALEAAFALGINFFDTANVYGDGRSERLIGELIGAHGRDAVIVSTKVGCSDYHAPLDFSPDALSVSVEGSLRRLGCEAIDLLMLHDPLPDTPGLDATSECLEAMRTAGKVRAIGVSVRAPDHIAAFLDRFPADAFQVNLNLLDQRLIDDSALARARTAGAAIIARTPLCFGFLSGRLNPSTTFGPSDHRARWPKRQIELWHAGSQKFAELLAPDGGPSLVQAALRFCLSFDGVASVIPGIMTPEEAEENAGASALGAYSVDELRHIRAIYEAHTFFDERPDAKLAME